MPAAAVIPAPIAYIKVVAVKKLVVGTRGAARPGLPGRCVLVGPPLLPAKSRRPPLTGRAPRLRDVYFEKTRVFKAGPSRPEYRSME